MGEIMITVTIVTTFDVTNAINLIVINGYNCDGRNKNAYKDNGEKGNQLSSSGI